MIGIQTPILRNLFGEGRSKHPDWLLIVWDIIPRFLNFEFDLVDQLLEGELKQHNEKYPKARAWYFYLKSRLALEFGDGELLNQNLLLFKEQVSREGYVSHDELYMLAAILFLKGDYEETKKIIKKAYQLAKRKDGAVHITIKCLYLYAEVLNRTGEPLRAKHIGDIVLEKYKKEIDPRLEIPLQLANARSCMAIGSMDEAKRHLTRVQHLLFEEQLPYFNVLFCHHWAEYHLIEGKMKNAQTWLDFVPPKIYEKSQILKNMNISLNDRLRTKEVTLDLVRKTLLVPGKIPLDLGNQQILTRMLKLFLSNPGQEYDKEQLIKLIWEDEYNPIIHDNKIYFMINRIRKFVEPDPKKPSRIIKGFKGYTWDTKFSCNVVTQ